MAVVRTHPKYLVLDNTVIFCDEDQKENHLPISPGPHAVVARLLDMTEAPRGALERGCVVQVEASGCQ
jgi:hypothetical protein